MYPNKGAFCFAVILILAPLLYPASGLASNAYEWTDKSGNVHFTDDLTRVPEAYRDRVNTVPEPTVPPSRPQAPPDPEPDPDVDAAREAYAVCTDNLEKTRKKLQDTLAKDQEMLVELNRRIHRTVRSRDKNAMQRQRAAVKARITETEDKLANEVSRMQWECERKKPYIP